MSDKSKSGQIELKFKRVLFKVSGEVLMGNQGFGINPETVAEVTGDIKEAHDLGAEIAIVVGGGNIFRGVALTAKGADRVTGDHMGMLATVLNALAIRMELQKSGVPVVVLSAIDMPEVCESFTQRALEKYLSDGTIVVFAAGTGNPYFTTDTAGALRACEMKADLMLKGTKVDGVYSADPQKVKDATRFDAITYDEVLERDLKIMDAAAFALMRSAKIPLGVFSIYERGGFAKILQGEGRCTVVSN